MEDKMADIRATLRSTMNMELKTIDTNYLENLPIEVPGEAPKKTKKKKLTKAERKALKIKKMQDFQVLQMRDHLKRELELSRKSAKRGHEDWESMCKEIKITELRQELEQWESKAQRLLHEKDEKILSMIDDIESTQEMHKRNFSKQLEVMNFVIGSYKTLVDTSKTLYETQSTELLTEFFEELNEKAEIEEALMENAESIMHATNIILEQQLRDDYQNYLEKKDDRVNTEIEKRYRLRDSIADKMKKLRKQLLDFIQTLQNSTVDVHKYQRIHSLMERQRNFFVESQKLNDIELRSIRQHGELQRELLRIEMDTQRKTNDLRLEYAYFVQVRKNIENNIELDRNITFDKLKILTSESYYIKKDYEKLGKYGELLLSLAANCRKLETESQKVVATGEFPLVKETKLDEEEQIFNIRTLNLKAHVDLTEVELKEQMEIMKNFWRRQSLVEMQIALLQDEKRKLTAENEHYINVIKSLSKADDASELENLVEIKCLIPTILPRQGSIRNLHKK